MCVFVCVCARARAWMCVCESVCEREARNLGEDGVAIGARAPVLRQRHQHVARLGPLSIRHHLVRGLLPVMEDLRWSFTEDLRWSLAGRHLALLLLGHRAAQAHVQRPRAEQVLGLLVSPFHHSGTAAHPVSQKGVAGARASDDSRVTK